MFNRTRLRVKLHFPVPQNPLQQTETQPSSYIHCCLLPVWLWLGTCLILGQAKGLWVCCSSAARGSWLCKSQATRTAPGQRSAGRLPSLTQNVQQAVFRIKALPFRFWHTSTLYYSHSHHVWAWSLLFLLTSWIWTSLSAYFVHSCW